jgi:putative MATE family efflux protein
LRGAEPKDLRDLTVGSVQSHLLRLALPIAAGMIFQTLYYIVDLYFVSHLGEIAIAGVAAAGNIVFLVIALTQIINAGTTSLLSQAVGKKDHSQSNLVFNQATALSAAAAIATVIFGYPLCKAYMNAVGANQATIDAGTTYLACFLPGLALQFILTGMGASLRATGLVKPIMIVQAVSLSLNTLLAPIMIAGWLTGHPLGIVGAGLASSIAVFVGVVLMLFYFLRLETYVHYVMSEWWPRFAVWRRLLTIGLPAGGELAFLFLYTAVIFALIRHFGDVAQAGFGIGNRLTQAIFLPGMAIAFAAGPLAGQNFGAGEVVRVRATLRAAIAFCSVVMVPLTILCQLRPEWLVQIFTQDPRVVEQGTLFLRIISLNFVATGIIFSCSAMFQGLGNTWPSLLSTGSRLVTFIIPAAWMSTWPHFRIEDVWYLSVVTVTLQAATSIFLVLREFRRKFGDAAGSVLGKVVEI